MTSNIPIHEQQIILAHILGKSREYVLAHSEIRLSELQTKKYQDFIKRRQDHEPMAYILGHKEFYGLDFKVTRDTLIPRPETEMLVKLALEEANSNPPAGKAGKQEVSIVDVGTGSGNIIISIAKNNEQKSKINVRYFASDISQKILCVARYNAKKHKVDKKIKFLKGDLLSPLLNTKYKIQNTIIVANLPYLSQKIYSSAMPDVKNFEPKPALLSGTHGLDHYERLFKQIKILDARYQILTTIIEFSPEQKPALQKLIRYYFPASRPKFHKDLAKKWRICQIDL